MRNKNKYSIQIARPGAQSFHGCSDLALYRSGAVFFYLKGVVSIWQSLKGGLNSIGQSAIRACGHQNRLHAHRHGLIFSLTQIINRES